MKTAHNKIQTPLVRYISSNNNIKISNVRNAFKQLNNQIDFKVVPPVDPNPFLHNENYVTPVNRMRLTKNNTTRSRQSYEDIDSIGAIGASLAHIKLWREAVETQTSILILEHRIYVSQEGINKKLLELLDSLAEKDIHFLSLSRISSDIFMFGTQNIFTDSKKIVPLNQLNHLIGMQAYWISPHGAKLLLNNAFPIDKHIDAYVTYAASVYPSCQFGATKYDWGLKTDRIQKSTINHNGSLLQSTPPIMIYYVVIFFVILLLIYYLYRRQTTYP
jgi:GR25 family glycosyltransferase involved in LPS biosynthesis